MKIVQVAPYFHPHIGGVESHVLDLSRALVNRGNEVTVVTSNLGDSKEREVIDDIKIIRIKPIKILFSTPIMPRIKKVLMEEEMEVIHSHLPPPLSAYYAAKVCKKKKMPFVITYHCDLDILGLLGSMVTGIYRRTFGAYTVKHANKIIVTTRSYAATSRAVWRYDPIVIPNAVDITTFNPNVSGREIKKKLGLSNEKVILFVGRLVRHKGAEYLIESAKYLEGEVKYIIVGKGDFEGFYKRRARELNVEENVIFVGNVPYNQLSSYYAACDIFVLPSVARPEAFGIVALEAMASGKPVIISDIPGVRELITQAHEGLLAEPMNAKDIAQKIQMLIDDESLRKQMGINGRKKTEECFKMSKIAKQIEDVYKEVLQSSTSSSTTFP